jgi:hypothetical protein
MGSTSGSCTLQEQAVAGTSVLTLPVGTGTVVANNVNSAIVSGTAVASTSGTSIDFTGIPSWAKRVIVMFSGVSTSGSSPIQIQLGSGSFETSGYVGGSSRVDGSIGYSSYSAGYTMTNQQAAGSVYSGNWIIANLSGNTWVENHVVSEVGDSASLGGGTKTFGGAIDRLRVTTVNGTDTFDAGSINILYE